MIIMSKLLKCCNKAYCGAGHASISALAATGGHAAEIVGKEKVVNDIMNNE